MDQNPPEEKKKKRRRRVQNPPEEEEKKEEERPKTKPRKKKNKKKEKKIRVCNQKEEEGRIYFIYFFKKKKPKFGTGSNLYFGLNWPEWLEHPEIGRNLTRGGIGLHASTKYSSRSSQNGMESITMHIISMHATYKYKWIIIYLYICMSL